MSMKHILHNVNKEVYTFEDRRVFNIIHSNYVLFECRAFFDLKVFRAYISITNPILSIILHTLFHDIFPNKTESSRPNNALYIICIAIFS